MWLLNISKGKLQLSECRGSIVIKPSPVIFRKPGYPRGTGATDCQVSWCRVFHGRWDGLCNQLHEHSCSHWEGEEFRSLPLLFFLLLRYNAPLRIIHPFSFFFSRPFDYSHCVHVLLHWTCTQTVFMLPVIVLVVSGRKKKISSCVRWKQDMFSDVRPSQIS